MAVQNFAITMDLDDIGSSDLEVIKLASAPWPKDVDYSQDESDYLIDVYYSVMERIGRMPENEGGKFAYVTPDNEPKYNAIMHALYKQSGWATENVDPATDVLCRFTEDFGNVYMYFCRGDCEPIFFTALAYGMIARI